MALSASASDNARCKIRMRSGDFTDERYVPKVTLRTPKMQEMRKLCAKYENTMLDLVIEAKQHDDDKCDY
ncbi:hypothetical protein ALC53_09621 [Atta colombica]|uniref:Uncharacterized protein n=1 Tax=Atta colombica TaxID=520822 RepID=A0A151I1D7_9HYME|nr:hypothetical protein ALC53_09621 [Atta colombica]